MAFPRSAAGGAGVVFSLRQNVLRNLSSFEGIFSLYRRRSAVEVINAIRRKFKGLTQGEAAEARAIAREALGRATGMERMGDEGSLPLADIPLNRGLQDRPGMDRRIIYKVKVGLDDRWVTVFIKSDDPLTNRQLRAQVGAELSNLGTDSPEIARLLSELDEEDEETGEYPDPEYDLEWVQRSF